MSGLARRGLDKTSLLGLPLSIGVVLAALTLEGGSARSLWQPTAMLVVFGGTCSAVLVSFPLRIVRQMVRAVAGAFMTDHDDTGQTVQRLVGYSLESRRRGILALEPEIARTADAFLRNALTLVVDGTDPKTARQILEIESAAMRATAEAPAEVLETAAGYTPTLGILGAVLGLIRVMESLSEPAKLGSGIAVAFVATVYGVGAANLVLLPLASRLRTRARAAAVHREVIIEGMVALQEGLNPRLIEQKLRGYVTPAHTESADGGVRSAFA
jgi:chemotaxis protein MotA